MNSPRDRAMALAGRVFAPGFSRSVVEQMYHDAASSLGRWVKIVVDEAEIIIAEDRAAIANAERPS